MKLPHAISVFAAVLFVALGVTSVLLDIFNRSLRIGVGAQEEQIHSAEVRMSGLIQTSQVLDEKKEWQERATDAVRKEIREKQIALQTQQDLITQGNTIAQQVGPNLLRDMATASVKNTKMRDLLAKHGYTVQSK